MCHHDRPAHYEIAISPKHNEPTQKANAFEVDCLNNDPYLFSFSSIIVARYLPITGHKRVVFNYVIMKIYRVVINP